MNTVSKAVLLSGVLMLGVGCGGDRSPASTPTTTSTSTTTTTTRPELDVVALGDCLYKQRMAGVSDPDWCVYISTR